jgi:hypothetical protein
MADFYPIAKHLADYVDQVIVHLALQTGSTENATLRVMEHLRIVLQAALEGDQHQEDMAFVLMRPEHRA